jgi:hypothetical protein
MLRSRRLERCPYVGALKGTVPSTLDDLHETMSFGPEQVESEPPFPPEHDVGVEQQRGVVGAEGRQGLQVIVGEHIFPLVGDEGTC